MFRTKKQRTLLVFILLNIPPFIGTLFLDTAQDAPPSWMILPALYLIIAVLLGMFYIVFSLIDWANSGEDS